MEQGRGSSVPWEKGVAQNGNLWIPSTPDKLVLQSSNNEQSEIQQNQMGRVHWHNLIDMYEDVLRHKQPHNFDLNISEGLNYGEHNHEGVHPAENYSRLQQDFTPSRIVGPNSKVQHSQDVAPVEVYRGLSLSLDPNGFTGVNNLEHSIQNVGILHKLRSLNQNAGRIGSYAQNLGEVVPPQEVDSFAELMNVMNARRSCPSNGSPKRSTLFVPKPTMTCPVSHIESNQVAYASVGERVQQNHIFHGSSQAAYASVGERVQQNHLFHGSSHAAYASVGERVQQNHIFHGSNQVAYARVGAGFPQSHVFYENHDGGGYQQEIPNSETADSVQAPESRCSSMEGGVLCNNETCFSCNSTREAHAQTVRGTILVRSESDIRVINK